MFLIFTSYLKKNYLLTLLVFKFINDPSYDILKKHLHSGEI
jgi:hypothetical protein